MPTPQACVYLQSQHLVHAIGHTLEVGFSAAADFRAVVLDLEAFEPRARSRAHKDLGGCGRAHRALALVAVSKRPCSSGDAAASKSPATCSRKNRSNGTFTLNAPIT